MRILKCKTIAKIITILIILLIIFIISYIVLPIIYKQLEYLYISVIKFINNTRFNINIKSYILNNFKSILFNISSISFNIFNKSFNYISKVILTIVLTVYIFFSFDKIINFIKNRFIKLYNFYTIFDLECSNYFNGLLIIVFLEWLEYTLLFFIVGHPNYLLLGILAGITSIIPVFGNLFAMLLALITSFVINPNLFYLVVGIAIICPIIDTYVIDPKIYKKTNQINIIELLLSMSIMSLLFGLIGIIFAIPFFLTFKTILKNKSRFGKYL